ncbi:MAG: hypothetical protein D6813_02135 [Calditrichaeota bacterium]|nr:MAG: hypothetical protein D6813_02135 [Calditrichota bacterium]
MNLKLKGHILKFFGFSLLIFFIIAAGSYNINKILNENDLKIARAIRQCVREADSTLLHTSNMKLWREYLKIVAMNLEPDLQPLVLIKFDEDVSFRNQLKSLIEWEATWHKQETEHYIYYYRWEQPPPEIILSLQDAHFNDIAGLFDIQAEEKIPYRYDPKVKEGRVFPFEDLRGGIISNHPFDLEKGARAIFYLVNAHAPFLILPLARIYGTYYHNESTAATYFNMCLKQISKKGYISMMELYNQCEDTEFTPEEFYSAYAFTYEITRKFGPPKVKQFLQRVHCKMEKTEFITAFEEVFQLNLEDFENRFRGDVTAIKM